MIVYRTSGNDKIYNDDRLNLINQIIKDYYVYLYDKINILQDHKGLLSVYWNIQPSEDEKDFILKIWNVFHEDYIEHFVISYKKISV
jgi:hypothetical protein